MSEEMKKQNVTPAEEPQKRASDLSQDEMGKVVGGAANTFLNIGDIDGESTSKDHKDWVTILKFDHPTTTTSPKP